MIRLLLGTAISSKPYEPAALLGPPAVVDAGLVPGCPNLKLLQQIQSPIKNTVRP